MAAIGICSLHAGTACSLQRSIDDSEQAGGLAVDGDENDTLPPFSQAFRPLAKPFDRQSKFGESLRITHDHGMAVGGAGRQCEQFVFVAAVERHNRNERWVQHGSKIATGLGTSPSVGVEFLL
jgi:hypothetical protein